MKAKPSLKQRCIVAFAHCLPSCKHIVRLASESHERRLTLRERIQMRLHFLICTWCQRYLEQIRAIREAVGRRKHAGSSPRMPDETRRRLKQRLREALGKGD